MFDLICFILWTGNRFLAGLLCIVRRPVLKKNVYRCNVLNTFTVLLTVKTLELWPTSAGCFQPVARSFSWNNLGHVARCCSQIVCASGIWRYNLLQKGIDAVHMRNITSSSAVLSVVEPLHPPVRQSGIHCRTMMTIFEIWLSDQTSFNEN